MVDPYANLFYSHFATPHNCILTVDQLIAEKDKLLHLCTKINFSEKIFLSLSKLISYFNSLDELKKRHVCVEIQNLKLGIDTIFEAESECDTIKLTNGNYLIKSFLDFTKTI